MKTNLRFLIAVLFLFAGATSSWAQNTPAETQIKILWDYKNINDKLELYEVSSSKPTELWEMGNAKDLSKLPVGAQISGNTLKLKPGETKRFVLVLKNNSSETLHFFAAPHIVNPPELSLGFKFKCLCINHVFKAPAGSYWYRVVEIRLDDHFKAQTLDVKHDLIKVDS